MKQHYTAKFLFFVFAFCFFQSLNARTCRTMSDGEWDQGEIWTCGAPGPQCGDTVYIDHFVEVTTTVAYDEPGCTTPMFLVISSTGELNFNSGRKLSFACGSGITLETGGIISSDAGGASENIKICNTTVWQGSWDESLDGPVVLGSGLPIELISFDAYYKGKEVNITWQTATETNNDYFTIERSENGTIFEPNGIVDGAGNSNALLTYFDIDHSPLSGTSYYRLKQTDFNGTYSYSKIVAVKPLSLSDGGFMIYPNPTDADFQLAVSGDGDEEIEIVISDLAGKKEYSKVFFTSADTHIESIQPNNKLAPGTYLITAISKNGSFTQKLIVR